jgi:hypothetical protein
MKLNIFQNKKFIKGMKIAGNILMVASLIFIAVYIAQADIDFSVFLKPGILSSTVLLGLMVSSGILFLSLGWRKNLQMFTKEKITVTDVVYLYTRSNLARYIPGNVMHFATRNILGSDYGLSQKNMAVSSFIELMLQILVALLLILALVSDSLVLSVQKAVEEGMLRSEVLLIIIVGIASLIAVALVVAYRKRKVFRIKPKNLLASAGYCALFCTVNATAFVAAANMYFDGSLSGHNMFMLGGYYLLAWFLGFITPGAPGGLGIREYVLLFLFSSLFASEDILIVSIIMRIITVLGDVFAYLTGTALKKCLGGIKNE